MDEETLVQSILKLLKDFTCRKLSAKEMINQYNDLICEYFPWGTGNAKLRLIEQFQNKLALYVENDEWREEDESYYGPKELDKYVQEFIDYLES